MSAEAASGIRFNRAVPQFTVSDLAKTAEYYRDILGFRISGFWESPPGFAIVYRDGVEFFFNRSDGAEVRSGRAPGAYDAYIHISGVDSLAEELRTRGADILEGPIDREYQQRELVVRDCNGLIIAFGEADTSQDSNAV